jgi:hypothetical protein
VTEGYGRFVISIYKLSLIRLHRKDKYFGGSSYASKVVFAPKIGSFVWGVGKNEIGV